MLSSRTTPRGWLLALAFLVVPSVARADLVFNYSINTAPLTSLGSPPQPFYVAFQFLDGNGTNIGNNTATIDNFSFGGGSAGAILPPLGLGVAPTSNINGTVTMTDAPTAFPVGFVQQFTPGSTLSFRVHLTTNGESPTPDEFSFTILDQSQTEIPTTGPANALLIVDITSPPPTLSDVQTFNTDTTMPFPSDPSGPNVPTLQPISVTPAVVVVPAVPEPASLLLLALGLGGLGARRFLRRHRNAA